MARERELIRGVACTLDISKSIASRRSWSNFVCANSARAMLRSSKDIVSEDIESAVVLRMSVRRVRKEERRFSWDDSRATQARREEMFSWP